ncbi:MAG: YceI family protein [Bacteroidota bacterium]
MIRIAFFFVLLSLLLSVSTAVTSGPQQKPQAIKLTPSETLVVFLQPQDEHFRTNTIPQLKKWCQQERIKLMVREASAGIPQSITATPAIIYANNQGRSTYASRYMEWNTIRNFIRTNRLRPRAEVAFCADQTLQMEEGRAKLNAPIKLTALQGNVPEDFSENQFRENALMAIAKGMESFQTQTTACLSKTDRSFYCDVHPYLDEAGMLFLSLEVYSMFNCIRPVYTTQLTPLKASLADQDALFYSVGQQFEETIRAAITGSEIGDRWSPLPQDTKEVRWESVGITTPATLTQAEAISPNFELAQAWNQPTSVVQGIPTLFFNFLPPLDRYAGEVPNFEGNLRLHPNGSIAEGQFVAQLSSMTMGMKELDDKVKKKYIFTKRFPDASFKFQLPELGQPLQAGIVNRIPINGTFEFMQKEIPLLVQAEFTPQLDQEQQPELFVHVDFQINVTDDFGVKGPDGPEDASKNMAFDLNFILSPNNN